MSEQSNNGTGQKDLLVACESYLLSLGFVKDEDGDWQFRFDNKRIEISLLPQNDYFTLFGDMYLNEDSVTSRSEYDSDTIYNNVKIESVVQLEFCVKNFDWNWCIYTIYKERLANGIE